MRVLILANNDVGLYKFRKELLKKLVMQHDVYVCFPDGKLVPEIKKIGVKFIDCPKLERRGKNPFKDLGLLMFYRKLVKKLEPDVVFSYTIKPNIYGGIVCAEQNIPYLVNITGLGTALSEGGLLQKLTLALYKVALRNAQKVFFQNNENLQFMKKNNILKSPYDILPGSGVNLKEYTLTQYPQSDKLNFIFVARIMKQKGIDEFLEAAQKIKSKYNYVEFNVYGFCEDDYVGIIRELELSGVIKYHGMVTDMVPVYRECSCIIHPSYYPEGISNVLLECAASGRPIITTDMSGCKEVVEEHINGFLVQPRNVEELVAKIELFINLSHKERERMGIEARKKVEREFNREQVIQCYLSELNKI